MVDITPYVKIYTKQIQAISMVFRLSINRGEYCVMPYEGHPKGCPNFNKCPTCPPHSPYMGDKIAEYHKFILIYAVFDFQSYKEEMKVRWIAKKKSKGIDAIPTENQLRCNLYWQSQIKKLIREKLHEIQHTSDTILTCGSGFGNCYAMESTGMDVFQTYRNNSIPFEEHPTTTIVMSVLVCRKKRARNDFKCQTNLSKYEEEKP